MSKLNQYLNDCGTSIEAFKNASQQSNIRRIIYRLCYQYYITIAGRTHENIALELGVSTTAVCRNFKKAIEYIYSRDKIQ